MKPVLLVQEADDNDGDMDDEASRIILKALWGYGYARLLGTCVHMNPVNDRYRIARGLLDRLGMNRVKVGIGFQVKNKPNPCRDLELISYIAPLNAPVFDGTQIMYEILVEAEEKSITFAEQGPMTGLQWLLTNHRDLFFQKVKEVAFMGAVKMQLSPEGYILPGDNMNINFDPAAAEFCFKTLQDLGIPMIITTRNAAFASKLDHSVFDKMGDIGQDFSLRVVRNTQAFFETCVRGEIGPSRNKQWFLNQFCDGISADDVQDDAIISKYVTNYSWTLYDPINLLAAIPEWRTKLFSPKIIVVNGVAHQVIGWSPEEHGVINPEETRELLKKFLIEGCKR